MTVTDACCGHDDPRDDGGGPEQDGPEQDGPEQHGPEQHGPVRLREVGELRLAAAAGALLPAGLSPVPTGATVLRDEVQVTVVTTDLAIAAPAPGSAARENLPHRAVARQQVRDVAAVLAARAGIADLGAGRVRPPAPAVAAATPAVVAVEAGAGVR